MRAGLPAIFSTMAHCSTSSASRAPERSFRPARPTPIQCKLAHGLLRTAVGRGARLFEADAVTFDAAGRSVNVGLANDREIEARSVILATGYVMPDIVRSSVHQVSSSWAIATVPQPQSIWNDGTLIWEDAKDYLYARTTHAGRIIIGGEDSTEIVEPEARDRLIPQKSRLLAQRLAALWPAAEYRNRIPLVRHLRYDQATDCR